jgi:hypothetical protein
VSRRVFIAGKINAAAPGWEFVGAFTSRAQAIRACTTKDHFVGPVAPNRTEPPEPQPWPGLIFPLLDAEQ